MQPWEGLLFLVRWRQEVMTVVLTSRVAGLGRLLERTQQRWQGLYLQGPDRRVSGLAKGAGTRQDLA